MASRGPIEIEISDDVQALREENRRLRAVAEELQRAEGELQAAKEEAEAIARENARLYREAWAANEAKDQFLATLSHELRTPLTPVLALVASLAEDPRLHLELAASLAVIRRNVELESRLIDDLLDLTRISRGKLELQCRSTDVHQVVEHALETSAQGIEAKRLRLGIDLKARDHHVWGDAPRLTQVFWNLLTNAIKFTPEGGGITVRSELVPGEGGRRDLVVRVTDTGIGIEPDVLPRIFGAFEQADRRITRQFGGLGLGLAVSRALVELHSGRLTAASEGRDQGSTFEVRLPVDTPEMDLDETAVMRARPRLEENSGAVRPLSILLVEDHPDTAEAMAEVLRLLGHKVTVAGSVAEALDAAQAAAAASGIELVVSDLGLPDGSGQDLMRELVKRHALPGIALSGYGMEEDVRKSLEAGFTVHLTKPVTPQMLRDAIRQVVR
ncbi:MAG TPA: ATP-binding protein [Thermoanaerobaculia bacterium]|nr:ATP-binding protein [Thermoanaerobaculia bacterium]